MLRKRIIFTLIYSDGYFMQSRNFRLQRVGDIRWLEKNYQFQKIAFSLDELVILNASRKEKNMMQFAQIVQQLSHQVFIPVAAGGGIRSLQNAEILFHHGADKIVLNTTLHEDPGLVKAFINKYGSQSVLASIDYKKQNDVRIVYIRDGSVPIDIELNDYLMRVAQLNVGEIYLNAMDQDGTGFGYDIETITCVQKQVVLPLIIAGGAGNEKHLLEGLSMSHVSAVATANLFNFIGDGLPVARKKILEAGANLAPREDKVTEGVF